VAEKPKSKAEELDDLRRQYPKAQMDWTEAEDRGLIEWRDQPIEELSRRFERQPGAIESRLKKLTRRGLIPREAPAPPTPLAGAPPEAVAPSAETVGMSAAPEEMEAEGTASADETAPPTTHPVTAPVETEPGRLGLWLLVIIVLFVLAIAAAFLIRWYQNQNRELQKPAAGQTTLKTEVRSQEPESEERSLASRVCAYSQSRSG
jgi:hypothetical protein